jgi:hypothetical protein
VPRSMPRQYRAVSPSGVTEQGAAQIRLQSLKGVRGGRSLRARANRARQLRTAPTTPSGYRLAGSLQATFRHRTYGDRCSRTLPARSYGRHQRKVWWETDVTGTVMRFADGSTAGVRRRSCSTLRDVVAQALAPNDCSRCGPTQHSEQCAYVAVNSVMPAQDDRANLNDSCI